MVFFFLNLESFIIDIEWLHLCVCVCSHTERNKKWII